MFDFPLALDELTDVPDVFHSLYEAVDDGYQLLDSLAQKLTAKTEQKIIETLRAENENLQAGLETFRAIAKTPDALSGTLSGLEQKIADLSKANNSHLIEAAATKAITAARGSVSLLLPHLKDVLEVTDDNGQPVVRPLVSADAGTLENLVEGFRNDPDFSRAFDDLTPSGSGMSPAGNGGQSFQVSATDQSAINSKIEEIAAGKITISL